MKLFTLIIIGILSFFVSYAMLKFGWGLEVENWFAYVLFQLLSVIIVAVAEALRQ